MLPFFFVAPSRASEESQTAQEPQKVSRRIENNLSRRIETRRAPAKSERRTGKMRQFRDDNGTITITNVPDKYEKRKGYIEVEIKYEPIKVAAQYKRLRSAKEYTSGTIANLVKQYSKTYALDENLVYAVIGAESGGNPYAVSSAGARGLMQLMPGTADEMGVKDIFDPAQNIAGGTQYLAKMLNLFDNNVELALAAYNAGPNAVIEHNGIPPYAETQQYVRAICAQVGTKTKRTATPVYAVHGSKPKPDALPSKKPCYIVHFRSGYTQAAEKVIDEDPYYYIQYGNRTALVRKERVAKISEPA
jgi:hypothetical protein